MDIIYKDYTGDSDRGLEPVPDKGYPRQKKNTQKNNNTKTKYMYTETVLRNSCMK